MCWSTPAKVLSIDGHMAKVDFGGIRREVIVATSGISSDDLVMIHAGVVIGKLSLQDFMSNMAVYRDILTWDLRDTGLDEKTAIKNASDEIDKLIGSLGINRSISSIEPEGMESMQVSENEIYVPSNAFKRNYKASLSDTDYLQVMHYTNYFRFCERAQQELLESLGFGYATLIHKLGLFLPTVETSGKLRNPVRLDNLIEVIVWVEEVGSKHVKFKSVIKNLTSNKIAAECSTISVCTDTTLMESMPLPNELVEKLEKYKVKVD